MKKMLLEKISKMSDGELIDGMYQDSLTGVWNRRAFTEIHENQLGDTEEMFVAIVDLDSLKWLNDNIGHRAGDMALMSVTYSLSRLFPGEVFRLAGDEFLVCGKDSEELQRTLEVDYRIFSFGVGSTLEEADGNLQIDRKARELDGRRSPRGIKPVWFEQSGWFSAATQKLFFNSVSSHAIG